MKPENKIESAINAVKKRVNDRPATQAATGDLQLLTLLEIRDLLTIIRSYAGEDFLQRAAMKNSEPDRPTAVEPKKRKRSIFAFLR